MKWEEAFEKLKKKYPGNKPLTCLEYDGKYIFSILPENEDFDPMKVLITESYFVDKGTGKVGIYVSPRHGTKEFDKQKKEMRIIFDNRNWF